MGKDEAGSSSVLPKFCEDRAPPTIGQVSDSVSITPWCHLPPGHDGPHRCGPLHWTDAKPIRGLTAEAIYTDEPACRSYSAWGCEFDEYGEPVDPRSCYTCGMQPEDHAPKPARAAQAPIEFFPDAGALRHAVPANAPKFCSCGHIEDEHGESWRGPCDSCDCIGFAATDLSGQPAWVTPAAIAEPLDLTQPLSKPAPFDWALAAVILLILFALGVATFVIGGR